MSDRAFTVAFIFSLGAHLVLLLGQLLSLDWFALTHPREPLEVVYEYKTVHEELRQLQEQLSRAKRQAVAAPSADPLGERAQIRIPDRPALAASGRLVEFTPNPASIIDLTNLVEAARGNPVLLSYFSAIREQIQRTANERVWLAGETAEGLVYVSFVLASSGAVQGAGVVPDRSAGSSMLRDVALQIVQAAAPFPPFPPSMSESSKTIVVPLEFLLGS